MRLLVIDHDPVFRCLLASLLGDEHLVQTTTGGPDAVCTALDVDPDVVLIGVHPYDDDGTETIRALKTHPRLGRLRIVALPARTDRRHVLDVMRAGADDYVCKSAFSESQLQLTLRSLCSPASAERPAIEQRVAR